MRNPDAMIAGVAGPPPSDGRFVSAFGGAHKVERIGRTLVTALERRGMAGCSPPSSRHGNALPTGMAGWLAILAGRFLRYLPAEEHETFLSKVIALLAGPLREA